MFFETASALVSRMAIERMLSVLDAGASRRIINEVKHGHVPGAVRVLVRVVQDDPNTKSSLLTLFLTVTV